MIAPEDAPWNQQFARFLMRGLARTPVDPNHVTFLSFLAGLAAAVLFALGESGAADLAAAAFIVAMFLDHADGELARLSGRSSRLGHRLDYLVGAANYTMLFIGLGVGQSWATPWMLALGLAAWLSNPVIVAVRMSLERRCGSQAVRHPRLGGIEIEDFAYLIGPITWLGDCSYFFLAYGFGALGYLLWTLWRYRRWTKPRESWGNQGMGVRARLPRNR